MLGERRAEGPLPLLVDAALAIGSLRCLLLLPAASAATGGAEAETTLPPPEAMPRLSCDLDGRRPLSESDLVDAAGEGGFAAGTRAERWTSKILSWLSLPLSIWEAISTTWSLLLRVFSRAPLGGWRESRGMALPKPVRDAKAWG